MTPREAGSSSGGGGDSGGGVSPVGGAAAAETCSICLEAVEGTRGRSVAKLQCGHEFHLDCIGSAFNAKGLMQCPNCRQVEEGNWLNATHGSSLPEPSVEDWTNDEDLYGLNDSEMPFRVDWLPLTQVSSSFEEGESSRPPDHYELFGRNSSPHLPYFQLFQPSHSPNPHFSSETLPVGPHSSGWEHHSPYSAANIHGGSAARLDSDGLPRGGSLVNNSTLRHSFGSRASSSSARTTDPWYLGGSCPYADQLTTDSWYLGGSCPYADQLTTDSWYLGGSCPNADQREELQLLGERHHPLHPTTHSSTCFLPAASSSGGLQDLEGTGGSCFYAWERDRPTFVQYLPVRGGLTLWGPEVIDVSSSRSRMESLPRQSPEASGGSEGSSSHVPRMHHFHHFI